MNKQSKRFGNFYDGESIPFQARVFERVHHDYVLPIGDSLDSQVDVEQAIAILHSAEEGDTVTILLSCLGGSHHVGDGLLYAMQKCKVPIHVIGTSNIASYATFVLLEADSFELSPFCDLLFHSASFGAHGKMADTLQQAEFTFKQCEKMLRYYYKHFFTEEELNRIIYDKYEHHMDVDEFCKRFELRNQALSAGESGGANPPDEKHLNAFKDEIFSVIEDILGQEHESGAHQTIAVYDAVIKVLGLPEDELSEGDENE